MPSEWVVSIASEGDIVDARQKGRMLAAQLGIAGTDLTLVATAISEVARNILKYAQSGEIVLREETKSGRKGVVVVARDRGPGIEDIERALQDGYSTGNGLGLGLPGAKRLMDEFHVASTVGQGTTVTMKKWALP
jgi:serine/threonine-protein kinase RsbT